MDHHHLLLQEAPCTQQHATCLQASPVTWGTVYKLRHAGFFVASLLSAILQRAANAGITIDDVLVSIAMLHLRQDPLVSGRLHCGGLSWETFIEAHLSGAFLNIPHQSTSSPVSLLSFFMQRSWCSIIQKSADKCMLGTSAEKADLMASFSAFSNLKVLLQALRIKFTNF